MSCCCAAAADTAEVVAEPPDSEAFAYASPGESPREEEPKVQEAVGAEHAEEARYISSAGLRGRALKADQFVIVLHRTEENMKIGLDTVASQKESATPAIKIKLVKSGLVSAWNEANRDKVVKNGDVIMDINGEHSSTQAMYQAIAASSTLNIVIQRG